MLGRSLALTAAAVLCAAPGAAAAPSAACPANETSGWAPISVTGWISTPEGAFYTTAPQYVAADFAAFLAGIDRDGDGLICRQVGVLNDGRPPFVWPGYPPVSFIDDAIRH